MRAIGVCLSNDYGVKIYFILAFLFFLNLFKCTNYTKCTINDTSKRLWRVHMHETSNTRTHTHKAAHTYIHVGHTHTTSRDLTVSASIRRPVGRMNLRKIAALVCLMDVAKTGRPNAVRLEKQRQIKIHFSASCESHAEQYKDIHARILYRIRAHQIHLCCVVFFLLLLHSDIFRETWKLSNYF